MSPCLPAISEGFPGLWLTHASQRVLWARLFRGIPLVPAPRSGLLVPHVKSPLGLPSGHHQWLSLRPQRVAVTQGSDWAALTSQKRGRHSDTPLECCLNTHHDHSSLLFELLLLSPWYTVAATCSPAGTASTQTGQLTDPQTARGLATLQVHGHPSQECVCPPSTHISRISRDDRIWEHPFPSRAEHPPPCRVGLSPVAKRATGWDTATG